MTSLKNIPMFVNYIVISTRIKLTNWYKFQLETTVFVAGHSDDFAHRKNEANMSQL